MTTIDHILQQAENLSFDDQVQLLVALAERLRHHSPVAMPRRRWQSLRGMATHPMLGDDAQAWVSHCRPDSHHRLAIPT